MACLVEERFLVMTGLGLSTIRDLARFFTFKLSSSASLLLSLGVSYTNEERSASLVMLGYFSAGVVILLFVRASLIGAYERRRLLSNLGRMLMFLAFLTSRSILYY